MPAILINRDAKAKKLDPKLVNDERTLRKYILDAAECLTMDEVEEDVRLVVVAREFPAGSGSIDLLAIDQNGGVYVIETKLYKNADKRKVLAQVLDYGAGLWRSYRSVPEFLSRLEEAARKAPKRPLREEIQAQFDLEGDDVDQVLARAAENVLAGRFRFVVLMDQMDEDLKNLISFVNANSEFSVFGVELEFYGLGDATLAIPRLYGAETTRTTGTTAAATVRDEAFFEQAEKRLSGQYVSALRELYEFSCAEADTVKWGRGTTGSFNH